MDKATGKLVRSTIRTAPIPLQALPAAWSHVQGLLDQGFRLTGDGTAEVAAAWSKGPDQARQSGVMITAHLTFERGRALVVYDLTGLGRTIPEAALGAGLCLLRAGATTVVEGGTGQMARALALAQDVARELEPLLDPNTTIEINCWTRAGRGGRRANTLRKTWTVESLQRQDPPAPAPTPTTLEMVLLKSWARRPGGYYRRGQAVDGTVYDWVTSVICGDVGDRILVTGIVRPKYLQVNYLGLSSVSLGMGPGYTAPTRMTHVCESRATAQVERP